MEWPIARQERSLGFLGRERNLELKGRIGEMRIHQDMEEDGCMVWRICDEPRGRTQTNINGLI